MSGIRGDRFDRGRDCGGSGCWGGLSSSAILEIVEGEANGTGRDPGSDSNSQYENNSHKNIHFEQLSMAGIPILPFIKLSAQAFRGSDFSTNVSK